MRKLTQSTATFGFNYSNRKACHLFDFYCNKAKKTLLVHDREDKKVVIAESLLRTVIPLILRGFNHIVLFADRSSKQICFCAAPLLQDFSLVNAKAKHSATYQALGVDIV